MGEVVISYPLSRYPVICYPLPRYPVISSPLSRYVLPVISYPETSYLVLKLDTHVVVPTLLLRRLRLSRG